MATPASHIPSLNLPPELDALPQEERIQLAIKAINNSSRKPDGTPSLSARQAALAFNIPRSTLTDRLNGKPTRSEAHAHEQALTPVQEEVLVEWIKVMGRRGIPLTATTLREHASDIAGYEIGESWIERFKKRHPDLKVKWTQTLEKSRAASVNPRLVNEFYDLLGEVLEQYSIPPENIYNMDEKGIQLGVGKSMAAFVDRGQKEVYSVEDGNRELVTVIETVSADGFSLQPSVIYQGLRRNLEWGRNNPCKAR